MNRVLIVGQGFIGTNLAKHFTLNNIPFSFISQKALYDDMYGFQNSLKSIKDDIRCVVNCTGYTGFPNVDGCEENKSLTTRLNVILPKMMMEACNKLDIPFLYVGSGCIYSGYDKEYTESDYPNFGLDTPESSFYSKMKHSLELTTANLNRYIFRIRIPFTDDRSSKNYLMKLLKYDNLINERNSITSVKDFCFFVEQFIDDLDSMPYGCYNVVKENPVKAEDVVKILKKFGLQNPNWNFIELDKLDTVAKRSNCVLSTDKIKSYSLELPNSIDSLMRDVKILAYN